MRGSRSARSVSLLSYAYGAALWAPMSPDAVSLTVYDNVLQTLFQTCRRLPLRGIRVQFQVLSAIQCWWCVLGPSACFAALDNVHRIMVYCDSGYSSSASKTLGGEHMLSSKDHLE